MNKTKTNKTRLFSDLDMNFRPHPVTKDITKKFDDEAIKQSLKNLLLLRHFEKPFDSSIGSPIKTMLFQPVNVITSHSMRRMIIDVITNHEPRVELIKVDCLPVPENHTYYVNIKFKIVNTDRPIDLQFILERTR